MKKCPYCAEQIPDEAVFCMYCGHNLDTTAINSSSVDKEPSAITSILLGILLLVTMYGIFFVIVWNWTGSESDLDSFAAFYQIAMMFIVTLLAVPGLDPSKTGCLRYVGIFVLSIIPILGWIVVYWAGKEIARKLS